jgi:hypothetical protein
MHKQMMGLAFCIAAFAMSASAQTTNTFPASGSVGIGTTAPGALLDVRGTISAGVNSSGGSVILQGYYPGSATAVWGSEYASGAPIMSYAVTPSTTASGAFLSATPYTTPRAALVVGDSVSGVGAGMINFYVSQYSYPTAAIGSPVTMTPVMSILNNGSVGIGTGTTAPAYLLDVAGQIHSSTGYVFPDGTTQTTAFLPANCGADYAEAVDVTGDRTKYEPGDVLVIDPKAPGKFLKSNQAYSTLVAGIYSTKPGFVGRLTPADAKTSASEVPMAMVGRVPTKVSAENGPIHAGDLLVASSKLGYAMKGTDRDKMLGAVVGKALGSLDSGMGVIEVLVTLQ